MVSPRPMKKAMVFIVVSLLYVELIIALDKIKKQGVKYWGGGNGAPSTEKRR